MSFEGKVIAITGGSSGIGLATAKLLFSLGAKLSIADYNPKTLGTAAATILSASYHRNTDDILITQLDVRSSSAVNTWVSATVEKFGKLDGAVNAAGVPGAGVGAGTGIVLTRNITDEEWSQTIDTNLSGLFYCLRAELNAMQNSGGGSIVNLASIAGISARPGLPDYAASKHGVVGLTKTAATEEGRSNIRINAVAPGPIDTPMLNSLSDEYKASVDQRLLALPIPRLGKAEEVAKVIKFLLSDEAAYITGEVVRIDGGGKA